MGYFHLFFNFVSLGLVFFSTEPTDCLESLQNNLFCVEWDVKPYSVQLVICCRVCVYMYMLPCVYSGLASVSTGAVCEALGEGSRHQRRLSRHCQQLLTRPNGRTLSTV